MEFFSYHIKKVNPIFHKIIVINNGKNLNNYLAEDIINLHLRGSQPGRKLFNYNGFLPNLINNFVNEVSLGNGATHILGLVSSGGVHSKDSHILELANILVRKKIKVIIHAFTDGRDVLPNTALSSLVKFNSKLPKGASIGTVMGRFFPMDRDNRWDRTQIAWKTLVLGEANYYSTNIKELIQDAYNRGETDEFISPTIIKKNEENHFKGIK